jgi:hypothetical protein
MNHFAQFVQQPINPKIQELIEIHFNVYLLYEDHSINSLQTHIQKMSINANSRGLYKQLFIQYIYNSRCLYIQLVILFIYN